MITRLLRFFVFQYHLHMADPSLAGGGGDVKPPAVDAAAARAYLSDFIDVPADMKDDALLAAHTRVTAGVTKHAPKPVEHQYKPEEVTAATKWLQENVEGFDPKEKKPGELMGLRAAHEVFTASDARRFLKSNGAKAEDVAKMSNADAIKAATEARAKPVEYGEFKYPEHFKKDEEGDKAFKAWLAEHKVPAASAQKLVDLYTGLAQKAANAPYELWKTTQQQWRDAVANDPEIGGASLDKNLAQIKKMIDTVAGPKAKAVREALDFTGAGNNPDLVWLLVNLSKAYAEGGPLAGGTVQRDAKQNPATNLYPNQPSEQTG